MKYSKKELMRFRICVHIVPHTCAVVHILNEGEGSRDLMHYFLFLSASHVVSSIKVPVVAQYFGNGKEQILLLAF